MGKLIVTDSSGATKEHPLDKERVTIGRLADNDIALNDKAVSGHHAVVITILQDSFLEDLDSTNGTSVNGKQIAKHPLSHGDVISIGRNTLKYVGEAKGDEDDFEKTMIIRPGQ
ncbi:MAG TPA: FHA domain-containing protein, partial [Nevskiaceae bacterium]|nr:FHA domain-containing protein [Nevskiaceae bacterium]